MSAAVTTYGNDLSDLRTKMRDRMAVDNYFNVSVIFEHAFLDANYHRELAQFRWRDDLYPHQLSLGPRGGGKTVINIDTLTAKFLLDPVSGGALITSYNLDTSKKILNGVLENIRTKPLVRELFPDICDLIDSAIQAKSSKDLKATDQVLRIAQIAKSQDPHFRASSLKSGITGGHYPRIITDDLIDQVNARSRAEIERSIDWFKATFNVMEHQALTPWHITGTHYNLDDPYMYIIKNVPQFQAFIQPGLIIRYDNEGFRTEASYWPSKFSVEDLHVMRSMMGPYLYAALIQQNPAQSDEATFQEKWLKWYEWSTTEDGKRAITRLQDGRQIALHDLNIFMAYDPAQGKKHSSARNAIVVVGIDSDENWYVLHSWAASTSVDIGIRHMLSALLEWEPDMSVCEEVLFSDLILPALQRSIVEKRMKHFAMRGVKPSGRSKDFRIISLQPLYEQGRVFYHRSQDELISETLSHPVGETVDLLDALAYIKDVAYAPRRASLGTVSEWDSLRKKQLPVPDKMTGY